MVLKRDWINVWRTGPFVPTEVGEPGAVSSSGVARHRVWRAPVALRTLPGLLLALPTAQDPTAAPAGCQGLLSRAT